MHVTDSTFSIKNLQGAGLKDWIKCMYFSILIIAIKSNSKNIYPNF